MKASDVMTESVSTIDADATIGDAMHEMGEHEVRHLPVMRDGKVVGILSDRDLRRAEGALARTIGSPSDQGDDPLRAPVTALLTGRTPIAVPPDLHVDELIDRLLEERVGAVLVCDGDSELLGIVSYTDILEAARGRLG